MIKDLVVNLTLETARDPAAEFALSIAAAFQAHVAATAFAFDPVVTPAVLDGLSATALLREFERETGLPRTPVIMLTANALDEHMRASHDAGADLHLSKPIHAQALIESIMNAISAQPDETAEAISDVA